MVLPYYIISVLHCNFANILMWLIFFYVSKGNKKKVKYSIIVTTIEGYAKILNFYDLCQTKHIKILNSFFIDQSNSFKFYYLKKLNIKNFKFIPIRKPHFLTRNIGIKQAKGKYFMFLDDDCYFNNLFLHNINYY